ncbi:hypothetical protein ACU4GD_29585 [Cupriavidus basilensis]
MLPPPPPAATQPASGQPAAALLSGSAPAVLLGARAGVPVRLPAARAAGAARRRESVREAFFNAARALFAGWLRRGHAGAHRRALRP